MSEKHDDGGPAFPIDGPDFRSDCKGMTLRDYFAGQALAAVAKNMPDVVDAVKEEIEDHELATQTAYRILTRWSYALADAMIAERNHQ